MTDIENFQKGHPMATLFDEEVFHLGWEAGAKWAGSSDYREAQAKTCNSPDRNRITDPFGLALRMRIS
jgi:hypothetical protein